MSEIRIVLDTSVIVSALLLPKSIPRQAFDLAVAKSKLLISHATIVELDDVLRRPKFNKYIPEERRLEFLSSVVQKSEHIDINCSIQECRDAKDNKFLELAVSGNASIIISGDQDLLVMDP